MRAITATVLAVALVLALLSGVACSENQEPPGIGIESMVDNDNGTLTITLTDGSAFTAESLAGAQDATSGQESLMALGDWGLGIPWEWDEGQAEFLIDAGDFPVLYGSGFAVNQVVQVYLVVAPTTSILAATVTTNSIGCFHAFPFSALGDVDEPVRVAADANLDWVEPALSWVHRDCCFKAEAGGRQVATLPLHLRGRGPLSVVDKANREAVTAQAAIESCLAEANCATLSTWPPWDGTRATSPTAIGGSQTYYASDYLQYPCFKATYTFDQTGSLVSATLVAGPGETPWSGVKWDQTASCWVAA